VTTEVRRISDPLVKELLAAREHHRAIAPPSETKALTPAEAYAVQDRLREALVARGERVVGWKAGFTSKTAQAAFGTDEPVCGFLLASGVLPSRAEVPAARFVTLVVEAEVCFVMRQDLAGPGVTPARALLAVEGALPALELVDFRYRGKPVGTDVVADGVYANAIVLGSPMTDVSQLDLAVEGLVYELNGTVAATNAGAEVMGNPLNSLAWIANHLGARGLGLRAGDLVMSGSISQLLRPTAGESVRASFTRLGSVGVRVV
jgi:2-keto-4-pentenoate hydratase